MKINYETIIQNCAFCAVCLGVMAAAVLIDLWTGLRAARKRGEKIKSRLLRRTITKIGDYWRVQAFGLIVDILLIFFFAHPYATMIVTLGEVLIEYRSVIENLQTVKSTAGGVTDAAREVFTTILSRGERGLLSPDKDEDKKEHKNDAQGDE